ncbi:BlaI/MecI/CopY family transcriptional regulator [Streptomyces sp. NPDC006332]|uniref:BlaI/MecI/CopY family transcriptional regulator n=1 Tax=Streptomyces sp. NPDC006332 TaxID=3155456 RepID=UPI0033BE35DB
MRRLGDLEAEVMDRLWRWGRPATVREVFDDLKGSRPVAYTTVLTVADNLHRKGLVRRRKTGRAWLYTPEWTRDEYTAGLMKDALGHTEDREAALLRFVEHMSQEDISALAAALRAAGHSPDQGSGQGAAS